jgi:hypothetical protein
MHMRRPGFAQVAAVAATAACCLAAAACGSTASSGAGAAPRASRIVDPLVSLTADEIQARALADLKDAPTATMDGTFVQSGQTFSVDLAFKRGHGCGGTVGMGSQGSVKIIEIGKVVYLQPDKRFWTVNVGSGASALLGGRYIQTTTTDKSAAQLAGLCNLPKDFNGSGGSAALGGGSSSSAVTVTKGPVTTLGGARVLELKDSDGSVAYVTESSKPELVQATAPKTSSDGAVLIKFTVGNPVTLTPPPASQVINGSQYGF